MITRTISLLVLISFFAPPVFADEKKTFSTSPKAFEISSDDGKSIAFHGCALSLKRTGQPALHFPVPSFGAGGVCPDLNDLDITVEKINVDTKVGKADGDHVQIRIVDEKSGDVYYVDASDVRRVGEKKFITRDSKAWESRLFPVRAKITRKKQGEPEETLAEVCEFLIQTGKFPKFEYDHLACKPPANLSDVCSDVGTCDENKFLSRKPIQIGLKNAGTAANVSSLVSEKDRPNTHK